MHTPAKFVKFKNASKEHHVRVPDLDVDVAPGEECLIEECYAVPRRSHAGGRGPSTVEQLAGCPGCQEHTNGKRPDGEPNHKEHCMLVPSDEADAIRFASVPDRGSVPKARAQMPSVTDLVAAGVPRGVAEQLVKAASAAAQAAKDGQLDKKPEPKAEASKPEKK